MNVDKHREFQMCYVTWAANVACVLLAACSADHLVAGCEERITSVVAFYHIEPHCTLAEK